MREVTFTVSPKRQYLGIACPTTPVYAAYVTTIIRCIKGMKALSLYANVTMLCLYNVYFGTLSVIRVGKCCTRAMHD